jgi:hypothetical protein
VGSVESGQELEIGVEKSANLGKVHEGVGEETLAQQAFEGGRPGTFEGARNRNPPQGIPVQDESTVGSRSMGPQLLYAVRPSSYGDDKPAGRRFRTDEGTKLFPLRTFSHH